MYQDFLLNFQSKNVSSSSHSAGIFAQIIFIARLVPVILSRVGVIYKTGLGLDDWIYCALYIDTNRDYKQYSAISDLHTLQFTVEYALGSSVFTSRIMATDL
jgi:hypothetical protein